ncbi:protein MIZU-KUSSEI 1-like [Actinidia eriantha]|uniref:protein MIZU-KUSSEI 1-like n=1 Tax=Actinidia eriantha TaxID=165200 RepID=UPI00258BF61B|nr:protein MIZU-KUSSEI 1-like [Actinidia eriantha]
MKHNQLNTLPRSSSCRTSKGIIPCNYIRSSPLLRDPDDAVSQAQKSSWFGFQRLSNTRPGISTLLRSLLSIITFPAIFVPTCHWLSLPAQLSITPSLGRKVTGTLFGNRRGHVSFAVQVDPRSEPVLLIEFAVTTSSLVKEMSSGLVRIALECEKGPPPTQARGRHSRLFTEPLWTMYCNGRRCGYALSRACGESDWHVLSTVQSVSVGAGVIPVVDDCRKGSESSEGELLYMRARFERVVGSRDSEAFYMMNPDGNGGPELSIFLLRI